MKNHPAAKQSFMFHSRCFLPPSHPGWVGCLSQNVVIRRKLSRLS